MTAAAGTSVAPRQHARRKPFPRSEDDEKASMPHGLVVRAALMGAAVQEDVRDGLQRQRMWMFRIELKIAAVGEPEPHTRARLLLGLRFRDRGCRLDRC